VRRDRPRGQIVHRQCSEASPSLLCGAPAMIALRHEVPLAPASAVRTPHAQVLRGYWQKKKRRRYLDPSLFSASGAGSKLSGDQRDQAWLRGCAGICDWLCGVAPAAPSAGIQCCSSDVLGHKSCRYGKWCYILAAGRPSGEVRLARRPRLPEGRTRQRVPIMAGYLRMLLWRRLPDRIRPSAPTATTVGAFSFFASGKRR
jgi:hypothetical protein